MGWVQVTPSVTLSNIIPHNNLLLNSYFENPTIELYILKMHANFHSDLIYHSIHKLIFYLLFKLQKLELNN